MFYRTDDGQGSMHINFGRKAGPAPCIASALDSDNLSISKRCVRLSVALCDGPAGKSLDGKTLTCDAPICERHRTRGGKNIDYCPRHQHLATKVAP
jgi:hypothetical protein